MGVLDIYSQLSMCSTARGSSAGLSLVGPIKIKARKSFIFTEGFPEVENEECLFGFVVTLYFTSLCCSALKMKIFTSIWSAQHPNACQNIQQLRF